MVAASGARPPQRAGRRLGGGGGGRRGAEQQRLAGRLAAAAVAGEARGVPGGALCLEWTQWRTSSPGVEAGSGGGPATLPLGEGEH